MIRSILIALAMLVGTTTCAQEGLPKFVQSLSSEDYAIWAAWQNRQAKLRTAEESKDSIEEPFIYSVRTTSSIQGGITIETAPRRYTNLAYRPPGSVIIHNPYARFVNNAGTPNWDKLFVPCPSGTMTVTEAMSGVRGPVSVERLFSEVMSEWFK